MYAAFPRASVGRDPHEYCRRSATSHKEGCVSVLGAFPIYLAWALPFPVLSPSAGLGGFVQGLSPELLPALLPIPCEASRVPYDGLYNVD